MLLIIYKAMVTLLFNNNLATLIMLLSITIVQHLITCLQEQFVIFFKLYLRWLYIYVLINVLGFKNPALAG